MAQANTQAALAQDFQAAGTTAGSITFLPEPEPAPLHLPIISVDDHVLEPPDAFTTRVPTGLRDRVPHVRTVDGLPHWVIEDAVEPILLVNAVVGRPISEWTLAPIAPEHVRPGAWDPDARIADMDQSGIWASLNFPSLTWGLCGRVLSNFADQAAGLAALRAYNDWYHEEWHSRHPDRFIAMQLPWLSDPQVAAAEVRRNADRGCHAVSFTENPEGLGRPSLYTDFWDPFFAACEETETVLNLHVGSSSSIVRPSSDSPVDVAVALFPLSSVMAVVDWIFAKIPVRFPNLQIVLSEGGVSWVPMIQERLQRAYRQCAAPGSAWSSDLGDPVDVLRRNFSFASLEDPSAFHQLDVIGADRVLVETDYPHRDSTWPTCQQHLRDQVGHLPRETAQAVAWGNAARLYQHPTPPDHDWRTSR